MSFDLPALPPDWTFESLDSCSLKGSVTYGIVQPGSPVEAGVPVIRVNNFRDTRIDVTDVLKVATEVAAKYERTRLQGGEVLLTVVGTVGQVAVAPKMVAGYNVARAVAVIHPSRCRDFCYRERRSVRHTKLSSGSLLGLAQ